MHPLKFAAALLAAASLVACSGGGSSGPTVNPGVTRGTLYADPPNRVPIPQPDGSYSASLDPVLFGQMLEANQAGLTQVTGTPKCTITTYYMKYATVGGKGEATDATGAIMVPSGSAPGCSGSHPVVLYAHGTTTDKSYNMANLRDNSEAALVAAMFAAQGFIVVAPNYAGYDVSSLPYHPYLNAEQQADDMIDALRAARKAFPSIAAQDSGKLFVTGYSEGGYVAMATQRAMQSSAYSSEFTVTALAGMSGPYALTLIGDANFAGTPLLGGTIFLPLVTTGWQNSYGNVYTAPGDIYEDPYAASIEKLLPSTTPMDQLFTSGKLPQLAMFAADSLPGPSSPSFAPFFGAGNLVKTSYSTSYLVDAQQNTSNTNPADPLNCTPANGLRIDGKRNDLRTYVPAVPTLLCGGGSDPTVFFASTQATQAYFLANGMPGPLLSVLDVDSAPTGSTDPYAAAKLGFAQAKTNAINTAVAANADPAAAVAASYHGTLVPPFCIAAARGFFQSVLQAQ
jgi:hypothetical protein